MTPIRVLFICHGNICRSPMAEFVLKDMVQRGGMAEKFVIASAATTSEEIWNGCGNPIYPPAVKKLAEHGIGEAQGVSEKRAQLLTRVDYHDYDYIIGMDSENLYDMKRICGGDPEGKIHLLLDFTDHPRSVADPWYTRDFEATWHDVEEGCSAFLNHVLHC